MSTRIPPRLHVVLARTGGMAVVFRRGPSRQVASFLWDRDGDRFALGQWLKGRIYERRADLAPDGRHLIYFAMNGKWQGGAKGSWTAVSRAPWLKALDLYPKGDCWEGGGLFLSNDTYWLNDRCFQPGAVLRKSPDLVRSEGYWPQASYGAEDTGVYYVRLQRDGWSLVEHVGSRLDSATIFEKTLPNGLVLRKVAHEQVGSPPGKGCYWDEHELRSSDGSAKRLAGWEWADLDGDRVVWAEGGCLNQSRLGRGGTLGPAKLLHDFNGYAFEAIAAPY
jgi:hypothetical protein